MKAEFVATLPAIRKPRPGEGELRLSSCLWLVVLVLGLIVQPSFAADTLIKARKVYTMTGKVWEPGEVLVTDGKISAVGQSLEVPEQTRVVDLGKGTLIPGLIDAYNSANVVAGEAEVTREVTPGFQVLSAINWQARGFREMLSEGTTCLNLVPGTDNVIAGLSSAVKTAGARQNRVVSAETGLLMTLAPDPAARNRSRTRPDSIYVRQPTNRMGVVWTLRSSLDLHRAGKLADDDGGENSPLSRAVAGRLRTMVVSRADFDILTLLDVSAEFGLSPLVLGGHGSYKVADRLAKENVPVVLAPLTTGDWTGPDETDLFWNLPGYLHKAGVVVALSGGRLLEQAQFATRFGLAPDVALQAITVTPARLLGIDDRLGALAPGHDADLVALSGEPLEFATSIRWVMVDGVMYGGDGELVQAK